MLLFGVLVFSYITGEYITLLDNYKESKKDFDKSSKRKVTKFKIKKGIRNLWALKLILEGQIHKLR